MTKRDDFDVWTAAYYFGAGAAIGVYAMDHPWQQALFFGVASVLLMAATITFRRWLQRRVDGWKERVASGMTRTEPDWIRVDSADAHPLATPIRSYAEAQRVCTNRVFLTGVPHVANEQRDGTWRIDAV